MGGFVFIRVTRRSAMPRTVMIYNTPLVSPVFLDAMSQLELVGVDFHDVCLACLQGIHHRQIQFFIENWIREIQYDFPYAPPCVDTIVFSSWYDFLNHYAFIIVKTMITIVKPLNVVPRFIMITSLTYDIMVVDYVY